MGLSFVQATVAHCGKSEDVQLLVDSGATYTVLPKHVWMKLKLKPKRTQDFILADGTRIQRDVSECHITLAQGECHTPVIIGNEGDEALLGAVTLEELALVLNPFARKLQPIQARLG